MNHKRGFIQDSIDKTVTTLDRFQSLLNEMQEALSSKSVNELFEMDSHRLIGDTYKCSDQVIKLRKEVLSLQELMEKEDTNKNETRVPQHWCTDPVAFAREALQIELYPHQAEFASSPTRTTLMIAGRGSGKSLTAQVKALHNAVTQPNHTVLIVSSGQRMSYDFGERLAELLRQSTIRPHAETITHDHIRFRNGSVVHLLPANADTIRGYHPKPGHEERGMTAILDEACFMEHGNEIRKAIEYALITAPTGHLYIVSSPSTIDSWVYDYVQRASEPDSSVTMVQAGSASNPMIGDDEIERLRESKNDLEFRAEVLGEWVEGAYGLFSGIIEPNIIQQPDPLPAGCTIALGVDLALSYSPNHDRNALAVVARYPTDAERCRILHLETLDCASDSDIRKRIHALADEWSFSRIAIEQYQGKALFEHLSGTGFDCELISPTQALQQVVFHDMHRLLRQNRLELPASLPDLFFSELRTFQYRRSPNGHISFGHPSQGNIHDDSVYAAAWGLHATQGSSCDIQPPSHIGFFAPRPGKIS